MSSSVIDPQSVLLSLSTTIEYFEEIANHLQECKNGKKEHQEKYEKILEEMNTHKQNYMTEHTNFYESLCKSYTIGIDDGYSFVEKLREFDAEFESRQSKYNILLTQAKYLYDYAIQNFEIAKKSFENAKSAVQHAFIICQNAYAKA